MPDLPVIVGLLGLAALVIAGIVLGRRRRGPDPVDSFRRQIDALSPEARRPTIDQVKAVDEDEPDET